jgi:hypothetical protein
MNLQDRIKKLMLDPRYRTWVIDSWWIKASAIEDALESKCQELESHEPTQMSLLDPSEKTEKGT